MASEDSDEVVSGLSSVHRLSDLGDLGEPGRRQVPTAVDELHALRELLEVVLLRRDHRILVEERHDHVHEVVPPVHDELTQVFAMVVVPPVDVHLPYSEELAYFVETCNATRALRHHEIVRDLVSGRVASSPDAVRLPHQADREASFSVYETDHPATELDQPFLLVFRTRHVVTLDITSDGSSSAGSTGFSSIWPDAHRVITDAGGNETPETAAHCLFQACHLRTVIVTAAVYRGLDSRLRPKANLSS